MHDLGSVRPSDEGGGLPKDKQLLSGGGQSMRRYFSESGMNL